MKLREWLETERGRGLVLAEAIGVSPVLISQWGSETRVPPIERCYPIERVTKGAVTRRDLRPQDWQNIWPELAPAHASIEEGAIGSVAATEACRV